MAWRNAGSFSRSVISAARAPSLRSPPPLPRLRPPTSSAPRLQSRRLSFATSREEWKRWVMHVNFRSAKGERIVPHYRYLIRVQLDEGVRDPFVLWKSRPSYEYKNFNNIARKKPVIFLYEHPVKHISFAPIDQFLWFVISFCDAAACY